jgi:hypothetical protein
MIWYPSMTFQVGHELVLIGNGGEFVVNAAHAAL